MHKKSISEVKVISPRIYRTEQFYQVRSRQGDLPRIHLKCSQCMPACIFFGVHSIRMFYELLAIMTMQHYKDTQHSYFHYDVISTSGVIWTLYDWF